MPTIALNAEQLQLISIVNDYSLRFPRNESGDADLLQACYDYMDAFKRVIDTTSNIERDFICQQYDGFYRFSKLMEKLAQGIADGVIDVPKDH